jgi:hypothetical protein
MEKYERDNFMKYHESVLKDTRTRIKLLDIVNNTIKVSNEEIDDLIEYFADLEEYNFCKILKSKKN